MKLQNNNLLKTLFLCSSLFIAGNCFAGKKSYCEGQIDKDLNSLNSQKRKQIIIVDNMNNIKNYESKIKKDRFVIYKWISPQKDVVMVKTADNSLNKVYDRKLSKKKNKKGKDRISLFKNYSCQARLENTAPSSKPVVPVVKEQKYFSSASGV